MRYVSREWIRPIDWVSGKKADYVLTVGEDKYTGSAYAHESIRVRDEGEEPNQLYIQIPAVDEGEENLTDKNAR